MQTLTFSLPTFNFTVRKQRRQVAIETLLLAFPLSVCPGHHIGVPCEDLQTLVVSGVFRPAILAS